MNPNILLIPRIEIQNANALSSPYTIGFPAMTAWLGAVHALQRKLNAAGFEKLVFSSAAVACHGFTLHTYKGQGDFVHSIIGTGNPLDKTGSRPSFIEEARCHLTVSLVIEYQGSGSEESLNADEELKNAVIEQLHTLKLAGGDILKFNAPELPLIEDKQSFQQFMQKLMPSYLLIERRELMQEAMQQGQDALSALLDYVCIHHQREETKDLPGFKNLEGLESASFEWTAKRKTSGWIIPIATGFHGISPLGKAENQRDANTPHRFAESIVTLGEFVMPYRIKKLADMLWHTHTDTENNLYLCQQNNRK
jgi:CRISPR-associated protein Csy2